MNFPWEIPPLDVHHIHRVHNGQPLPEEQEFVPASQFELLIIPFTELLPVILKATPSYPYPTFGFNLQDDYLLKRDFIKSIKTKSPGSEIFSNPRYTNKKMRGDFVNSIHGTHVFTSDDPPKQLRLLHDQA